MKKKAIAAVLAASMLMMTACSSAEETTVSSESETEATKVTEVTEITDETTAETEAPQEDVIIPLWSEMMVMGQNRSLSDIEPESWFTDFENTVFHSFEWDSNDKKINGCTAYRYQKPWNIQELILTDSTGTEEGSAADIYFVWGTDNSYVMYIEVGENSALVPFVPFFYNETGKYMVGYYNNGGSVEFKAFYWSSETGEYDIGLLDDISPYEAAMA